MTDNEIIKALEYCKDCSANLNFEIIDLINRKQAEIERLKTAFENSQKTSKYWDGKCTELVEELETAKAEAIKEFMKRLKLKADGYGFDGEHYEMVDVEVIDDTYEEMVGERG